MEELILLILALKLGRFCKALKNKAKALSKIKTEVMAPEVSSEVNSEVSS